MSYEYKPLGGTELYNGLCAIFDLDVDRVRAITLYTSHDSIPIAKVEMVLTAEQCEKIIEICRQHTEKIRTEMVPMWYPNQEAQK